MSSIPRSSRHRSCAADALLWKVLAVLSLNGVAGEVCSAQLRSSSIHSDLMWGPPRTGGTLRTSTTRDKIPRDKHVCALRIGAHMPLPCAPLISTAVLSSN